LFEPSILRETDLGIQPVPVIARLDRNNAIVSLTLAGSKNPSGHRFNFLNVYTGKLMQVRLLRPTDVQIAKQLLRQLGYEVATDEVIGRIDRVLASRNHYAAVVEDREKVLGLVHVYERPALEKPCEAVVQALIVDGSYPTIASV
jgi:hypothetical protein